MLSLDIAHIPLFKDLPRSQLDLIEPLLEYGAFDDGVMIFDQGHPAKHLYILLSGEVVVQYKPDDGQMMTVAHIHPGGVFGWSAAMSRRTYTAAVLTVGEVETYRINGKTLRRLCNAYPDLGIAILDRLASIITEPMNNTHAQILAMLRYSVKNNHLTESGQEMMEEKTQSYSTKEQLNGLIEQLDAYISQYHGGSVELVSFDGKVVQVKLGGACEGCPLSPTTLHGWVEGTIRQFFPEVERVEAAER